MKAAKELKRVVLLKIVLCRIFGDTSQRESLDIQFYRQEILLCTEIVEHIRVST